MNRALQLTRALRLTAFVQMLRTSQSPETLYVIEPICKEDDQ